jgi:ribosomal protein L9
LSDSEILGQCPERTKNVKTVGVIDVRASFARNYGAKGGLAKSADAQRQAFTRALKAVLAEGLVKQDSWNGADWLWRDDE